MKIQRRDLLKWFGAISLSPLISGCNNKVNSKTLQNNPEQQASLVNPADTEYMPAIKYSELEQFNPGYLTIIQGPTNQTEACINIMSPRLKKYTYEVINSHGQSQNVNMYAQLKGPLFYNVDKIKVIGLQINENYTLRVVDVSSSGSRTIVDERIFQTLDTTNENSQFALVSCMADDYRFNDVIDPMWKKLENQNVDLIFLTGDLVYIDSREFVERQKATDIDIWQRYTDALRRIPLYHWKHLKPILATWDDHDFGTNDGDRNFTAKQASLNLFEALFHGPSLNTAWTKTDFGTSSVLEAFGQRFFLMDDRFYRQPNKNQTTAETYGHWGQEQHEWLISKLSQNTAPAWIINGNQIFNGAKKTFIESLEQNHPAEFTQLMSELGNVQAPVVFASGDIHLSEVMRVPTNIIGYETFEFTSSSMHSYASDGWDNPMRVEGAYSIEFNFMVFKTQLLKNGLNIDVQCIGLNDSPYFTQNFKVNRN